MPVTVLAPYADGKPIPKDMEAMVLARTRQLAAHEVGHTLGLMHNFAASSVAPGTSVMDYPHPWITLDAKDADGTVTRWMIETGNPNALIRAGWRKDSLKPGDEVIVQGYRSKDGSNTVNGSSVRFPDGRKLLAGSSKDGGAVR